MLDLVVIRGDLHGLTKGKKYRMIWADRDAGTVCIKNDEGHNIHVQLDIDAIILGTGNTLTDSEDFRDMFMSLTEAIHYANGDPRGICNDLKKMTVWELMTGLAPNKVRFVCTKKRPEPVPEGTPYPREIDLYEGNRG